MSQATTRFIGLDVHKATITVAVAAQSGPPELRGTIANDPKAIRRLFERLAEDGSELKICYEAGPTGYALQRQLSRMGLDCQVVAPSLMPRQAGRRVKTDARDAISLARLLRSGDLTPVFVPDPEHEALRDLVRARADARTDLLRARHRLSKFLLRQGLLAPVGVRNWSTRHQTWLNQLRLERPAAQVVLEDYRAAVRGAQERLRRLEAELGKAAQRAPQLATIVALMALRGIALLSAVTIVAEAGDLRRFPSARQFMGYTGLVPSEHSSGQSQHRGPITKTGNAALRHVLVQAAHNARYAPVLRNHHKSRLDGLPADLVELAWRAQLRLHSRFRQLDRRLGRPKTVTAVARELAGFVWAVGQRHNEPAAA